MIKMYRTLYSLYRKGITHFSGYGIGSMFPPLRAAYDFLEERLRPRVVEVNGVKIFLHPQEEFVSESLLRDNAYEAFETKILCEEIKPGHVVLDIGANIGYYTLLAAKLVGEQGRVFAFEPEHQNFALMNKSVKANGFHNVTLVRKAVYNATGPQTLYINQWNRGDNRIFESSDDDWPSVTIDATRLDDYFANYQGSIDFIKMDIQGAEITAIEGMSSLLNKHKRVKLFTEFEPITLKAFGFEPADYLELLQQHGFTMYHLDNEEYSKRPANIDELLETYTVEKENYTNLLCIRE